jgi:hypothetical protein
MTVQRLRLELRQNVHLLNMHDMCMTLPVWCRRRQGVPSSMLQRHDGKLRCAILAQPEAALSTPCTDNSPLLVFTTL